MNNKEIFQKSLALIKNSKTWCKDHYARTKNGDPCQSNNSEAVMWCSVGALEKASNSFLFDDELREIFNIFNDELYLLYENSLGHHDELLFNFNDTHSHAAVINFWEYVGEKRGWL